MRDLLKLQQGNWSGPHIIGVPQEDWSFQVLPNGKGGEGSALPIFKLRGITGVDFVTRR